MRPLAAALILLATPAAALDLGNRGLSNPTAYIPPQCYTETVDAAGEVHNPCATCHVRPRAPNYVNDADLQEAFSFPAPAVKNPWANLFRDRSEALAALDPDEIDAYVATGNYFDADGEITLARRLASPPSEWDADGDGAWAGYVPDAWFAFDAEGFDHAPDGRPTGWRAFAYMPLPGGFWPTNGSTDDVLIRLPEAFRTDAAGRPDTDIYKVNLAILEALIARREVAIDPVDETRIGVDLDKDGTLGRAETVVYDWAPLEGRQMSWVGAATGARLAAGLFPLGTEFLHTVRYIDVSSGGVAMAPRLKELRYAVKTRWQTYADLEEGALAEAKERAAFPDRIALFDGGIETGIGNGTGWRYQGFIEDAGGALRPQSFEETVFCMGCHGGIGVTDDSAFAFPRKLNSAEAHARGWYHWTQKSIAGVPDPMRADGRPELRTYLEENGAGDEFRSNAEVIARFFDGEGNLRSDAAEALSRDVSVLLFPSAGRARHLNASYREIVREQSFALGRDAVWGVGATVHREVEQNETTGIETPVPASNW